jgi:hypothetical protein
MPAAAAVSKISQDHLAEMVGTPGAQANFSTDREEDSQDSRLHGRAHEQSGETRCSARLEKAMRTP